MKRLVISPHPDDAELAMGGTIAKMVRSGDVLIAVACLSDYPRQDGATKTGRMGEFMKACLVLGATPVGLPLDAENKMDLLPRSQIIDWLQSLITDYKPDELYVPLSWYNQDHTAVWEAVLAMLRKPGLISTKTVWAYEMPGQEYGPDTIARFGWEYRAVSHADLLKKESALCCYDFPALAHGYSATSADGAVAQSRYHGMLAGVPEGHAERFLLLWSVK